MPSAPSAPLQRLALLAAVALVSTLSATVPAAAATPACGGRPATIVGTHGADWILGTPGDDVIVGLGGDDHICGGGGDDALHGGRGHDTIDADAGADAVHGGGGRDHLSGGPGADRLNGGFGVDETHGNGGSDRCWGETARCESKVRTHHRRPAGQQLVFTWRVDAVDETNRARVASTWRPGCPVGVDELRLVGSRHRTDDGRSRTGELVLHRDHVSDVVTALGAMFDADFPIHRMDVVDVFGGDDGASMRANNTSAYNCRTVSGTGVWSQHAYGRAVDINPLVNPWVQGAVVDPPEGAAYVVRDPSVPGLIVGGDVVTRAFAAIGWGWGGNWSTTKDYQHFSSNNR